MGNHCGILIDKSAKNHRQILGAETSAHLECPFFFLFLRLCARHLAERASWRMNSWSTVTAFRDSGLPQLVFGKFHLGKGISPEHLCRVPFDGTLTVFVPPSGSVRHSSLNLKKTWLWGISLRKQRRSFVGSGGYLPCIPPSLLGCTEPSFGGVRLSSEKQCRAVVCLRIIGHSTGHSACFSHLVTIIVGPPFHRRVVHCRHRHRVAKRRPVALHLSFHVFLRWILRLSSYFRCSD